MGPTAGPTTRQLRRSPARGRAPGAGYAVATTTAGVLAGACYSSFLLARPMGSRLSTTGSYVSELEVAGQPASAFFRLTDLVSGLLIVALAVALLKRLMREDPAPQARERPEPGRPEPGRPERGRLTLGTAGCLFLAGAGLAAVVDALDPMPCAPSVSEACRRHIDDITIVAQLHQGHTLSSVLGILAAQAAMLLLGWSPRLRRHWPGLARASLAAGLTLVVLGLAEVPLSIEHRDGAVERIHVLLISAWLAGLGWWLSRPLLSRPLRVGPNG